MPDEEAGIFTGLTKEEFEARYQCYDFDLERAEGVKPWENKYNQDRSVHEEVGEEGGAR